MSLFVTLAADVLVAVLLVATIVSCLRLSKRIVVLKADEAAMRQTIGDLVVATANAERAIKGLRAALDECDRTLADRLDAGGKLCAELVEQVGAGEGVVARIGAIVAQAGGGQVRAAAPTPRVEPDPLVAIRRPVPVAQPEPPRGNGERISATLAAAQAMSERALGRIRARAA